jgi:two-component system sensor kinase FixL
MTQSHSTKPFTSPATDIDAARGFDEGRLRLAAIVETAVDGIITIDEHGIVESFNLSAARMFGYAPEEVIGNNIKLLMPPQYREHHDEYLSSYVKTGVKKIIGIGREVSGRRKDGTVFPMHLSVSEVQLGHRRLFTGIVHDLTEQKKLEKQVLQAERLATIGKMAAKVAHEIRNPLSSISLNAELLQDELNAYTSADTAEAQSLLQSMMAEIDRVTSLTEEYLQFSRLPEPQPVLVSLNQVLEDTLGFVSHELRQKRIEVEYYFRNPSLPVRCDAVQVRRAFLTPKISARGWGWPSSSKS